MKTAIITGASSGIGRATAELFAKNEWKTLLIARNQNKLKQLKERLPNSEYFVCDLTDSDQIKDLIEQLSPFLKNLKALVNNAGVYRPCSTDEDNDEVWKEHFNSNLMSAVRITRLLWPTLKKNQASIVNVSSTLAIRPIENTGAYSAIKAAMNNWTLSLALEGAEHGIRANSICPGLVDTPIHGFHSGTNQKDIALKEQLQHIQPLGRMGEPEDIAAAALHMCSEASAWTTGTVLNVDGGILLNSSPS